MNVKIEAHSNHKFERKLENVPKWKVPPKTRKEITEFIERAKIGQVQEGKKLSNRTLSKYLSLLKRSLELINKQTDKITKKDIEKFDKALTEQNLKSAVDYRRCLKVFLKWRLGEDKMRDLAGWLDTRDKDKTPDYLTEQEVEKLFKDCKSNSERFLIAVLFDSGARAEEFLNIRYEDIQLPDKNSHYPRLMLKKEYSKTEGRNISLYWKHSLSAVRDFLKDREAEGIKSTEQVFNKNYDAMRMFLARLGKKLLGKEVYPHLFRHSSATHYATKLNRQELCYRYGWKFSSDMPDIYISRSGMESKELDEKFKATELEQLQKQFESKSFETERGLRGLKDEVEKIKLGIKKEIEAVLKTLN